jgi:hemerythrin-like domain-containing protein
MTTATTTAPDAGTATPADTRDMVLVHRVFRRELSMLPGLVTAVPDGDAARAAVLAAHWDLVSGFLHHHHTGEDAWLWERLLDRSAEARALVDRMERGHTRVDALLQRTNEAVAVWKDEPGAGTAAGVASATIALHDALVEHLDDEEATILPIVRSVMTQDEWSQLCQEQVASLKEEEIPLIFGALLEGCTTDAERDVFLRELPPPVREIATTAWAEAYAAYIGAVRG